MWGHTLIILLLLTQSQYHTFFKKYMLQTDHMTRTLTPIGTRHSIIKKSHIFYTTKFLYTMLNEMNQQSNPDSSCLIFLAHNEMLCYRPHWEKIRDLFNLNGNLTNSITRGPWVSRRGICWKKADTIMLLSVFRAQ